MNEKKRKAAILISISFVFLTSLGFNIYQQKQIKELRSELDYCESKRDDLENTVTDLENELEECNLKTTTMKVRAVINLPTIHI